MWYRVSIQRKSRIHAPEANHYIIVREIARRKVYADYTDRINFLVEWSAVLLTQIQGVWHRRIKRLFQN